MAAKREVTPTQIPDAWVGVDGLYKVTPGIAAEMLRFNLGNRSVDAAKVSKYATLMRDGKWKDNGQTVSFTDSLQLMNGQHRLMACIESGVAFKTRIAWGVDPTSFDTIDVGRRRTTAQVLGLAGEQYTYELGAVLRMLLRDENGLENPIAADGKPPEATELLEVLSRHDGVRASVQRVCSDSALKAILLKSVGCYLHYQVTASKPAESEQFFRSLADGVDLTKTSPVRVLRERLIQLRGSETTMRASSSLVLAITIKAWNAFIANKPVSLLRWSVGEAFPKIDGIKRRRRSE